MVLQLIHGTTRKRAELILKFGPNPNFIEPGGTSRAESFCTCVNGAAFTTLGHPSDYARSKSAGFQDEGGPVMIIVDVPGDVVAKAVDEVYLPLSQGVVQFDEGAGLEELRLIWPTLRKKIIPVDVT